MEDVRGKIIVGVLVPFPFHVVVVTTSHEEVIGLELRQGSVRSLSALTEWRVCVAILMGCGRGLVAAVRRAKMSVKGRNGVAERGKALGMPVLAVLPPTRALGLMHSSGHYTSR